ncbi:MAG: pilus assembly protein TadB [Azospirillum sp.]|nr:pilus assembly protein TadB [Azospirillum sp.]
MNLYVIGAVWLMLLGVAAPFLLLHQSRWSSRARLLQRAEALGGRARPRSDGGSGEPSSAKTRQKLIQSKLKELEKQRNKSRKNSLSHLLVQADAKISVGAYFGVCFAVGILVLLLLLLTGTRPLVAIIGAIGAGFVVPRFVIKSMIKKRQKAFTENFADALDILVRGTRTGLPVGECLRVVGREVPDPVGYEFRMLVESQRLGMEIDQSLARGLERMPTAELQFFAIVLLIQQQTGGNLAATLENLSHVLRARKRLGDKIQSLSSEAKASAMMIGSLPFVVGLLVWAINPQFIGLLFTTRLGNVMLIGGLSWMGMGVMVMRGMINFKV